MNLSRTWYLPIHIGGTTTFDRIGVKTRADFSGTASVRLGIYNNSRHKPTTVKLDAGTISCTASSTTYSVTISQSLDEGWYWLAVCLQTAGTVNNFFGSPTLQYPALVTTNTDGEGTRSVYWQDGVTGAFATAGTLGTDYQGPIVHLRAA